MPDDQCTQISRVPRPSGRGTVATHGRQHASLPHWLPRLDRHLGGVVGHLYRGLEPDRLIGYNADDCQSYADNRCPGPVLH